MSQEDLQNEDSTTANESQQKPWEAKLFAVLDWLTTPMSWGWNRAGVYTVCFLLLSLQGTTHTSGIYSKADVLLPAWMQAWVTETSQRYKMPEITVSASNVSYASIRINTRNGNAPELLVGEAVANAEKAVALDSIKAVLTHEIGHFWQFLHGHVVKEPWFVAALPLIFTMILLLAVDTPLFAVIVMFFSTMAIQQGRLGVENGMWFSLGYIWIIWVCVAILLRFLVFGWVKDAFNQAVTYKRLGRLAIAATVATLVLQWGRVEAGKEQRIFEQDADIFAACTMSPVKVKEALLWLEKTSSPTIRFIDRFYDVEHQTFSQRVESISALDASPPLFAAACKASAAGAAPRTVVAVAEGKP